MATSRFILAAVALCVFLAALSPLVRSDDAEAAAEEAAPAAEAVVTLDADNFDEVVGKSSFIVVEFYAPWCGHCKRLAPEYEKAASLLSSHDPPIVLAKVDANDEKNKELATKHEIQGFPTIKIFRNNGKNAQEYKGPREADGIVEYLKKQAGPASAEIKSADDASSLIDEKKVFIVGVFTGFSGTEFEKFTAVAEKLRAEYDFGHTLDVKYLPRGDSTVKGPFVRVFKPFDELVVDFKDFDEASLEKSIVSTSMPLVVKFDKDPNNHPYLMKFFSSKDVKVMLFVNFTVSNLEAYQKSLQSVAEKFKGKLSFLIGDIDSSQGAFQFYGLKEEQAPLIIIQEDEGQKYLKPHLEAADIIPWVHDYLDGKVAPFKKSEPIPEVNDEPVKVVVADNINDVVFNSGKNVLIEFYAPWCGHCKKLAPILEEVAVSLQSDEDFVIAKMDATANDVPKEFEVQGYPTLYFRSAKGMLVQYVGGRTAEEISDFIKSHKNTDDKTVEPEAAKIESVTEEAEAVKDEL